MKVIVLIWGGLIDTGKVARCNKSNPYSDVWLNNEKSAEVIVLFYTGRTEQ
jgi:hypothetical protein